MKQRKFQVFWDIKWKQLCVCDAAAVIFDPAGRTLSTPQYMVAGCEKLDDNKEEDGINY